MKSRGESLEANGTRIHRHPTEPLIAYPSGNSVIISSVLDPTDSFVYLGHTTPTTVAKFSPNVRLQFPHFFINLQVAIGWSKNLNIVYFFKKKGVWIVSGDSSGFVRIWSWSDANHLTKFETQLFTGSVLHIDWNVESRIILALGQNSDSDKQIAKSINFDTMEHSEPVDSHNRNGGSTASSREKISVSVRNDSFLVLSEQDTQHQELDERSEYHRSPNYLRDSSMISSKYCPSPIYTPQKSKTLKNGEAHSESEAPSPKYQFERNSAIRNAPSSSSPSPPPPPSNLFSSSKHLTPPSTLNSSSQRKSFGIAGSDTVLDRLRAVESSVQAHTENSSLLDEKIRNISEKIVSVDSSIHPAIYELQQRFDRELMIIRKEFESR